MHMDGEFCAKTGFVHIYRHIEVKNFKLATFNGILCKFKYLTLLISFVKKYTNKIEVYGIDFLYLMPYTS